MNRVFVTLVKREFWENRSLWIAPLAAAALILVGSLFIKAPGNVAGDFHRGFSNGWNNQPHMVHSTAQMSSDGRLAAGTLYGTMGFLGMIATLAIFAYLTDCLFAERKDRSILFWKSMPVSDAQTVLSKFFVAMVVMPLGVIALGVVTYLATAGIFSIRFDLPAGGAGSGFVAGWFSALGTIVFAWLHTALWYAPVAAYVMLASVLAKRAPFLYVVMPPVAVMLAEKWLFDTSYVAQLLKDQAIRASMRAQLLSGDSLWSSFQDIHLWLGLAVAAGMLYIVIRLRRYRDDT